ncbi:MAG: hypothetical protein ACRDV2_17275 [Actinomycetes bacterium]
MTTSDDYRTSVPDHLDALDLVDPARLLRDLASETSLLAGRSLLCLVHRPATDQRLVSHTDAWPDGQPSDEWNARKSLEDAMRRIGHRDWEWDDDVRLTSVVVTVMIRDGLAVLRSSDFDVVSVLRYANNPFQALRGDLIVVTPHGWITAYDGVAGLEPIALLPKDLVAD